MKTTTITYSLETAPSVLSEDLLPIIKGGGILLFVGQLGAGKTTLIKALTKILRVEEPVSSPTFSYVNTYTSGSYGLTLYHFDLYRLNSLEEFIAQGFDEYLTKRDSLIIIEWPEIIEPLLTAAMDTLPVTYKLSLQHDFTQPEIRHLIITAMQPSIKTK